MEKLRGIIPVTMSPINEDESIDEDGHRKMLDFTLSYRVGGFWLLGSASEDFLMSYDQRVSITRITAEHVNGRAPIIVGSAFPALEDTYRFFDDTAEMKIDAYHILPPDKKMSAKLTIRYIEQYLERAPKPVWFYNNPLRALKIPVEAVREFTAHPKVAGIKAAGYDLKDIIPFCMMESEDFQTIGSGGSHLLVFLALGSLAHTISPACMFPGHYCEVYDLWMAGKLDEARGLSFRISRMIKALPHPPNTEFSAEEKVCMEIMGICKRHVYSPYWDCSDQEKEQARKVLEENGIIDYYAEVLGKIGAR